MPDYRHAGVGWPNGAVKGSNKNILALPSQNILLLSSEHWHHDAAVRAGKRVLFRGMARQGFRPAEVGWNAGRYVDEITRDAVRVSEPIREFVAWNELNLQDERGDNWSDHGDLTALFSLVGQFQIGVIRELRRRMPGVVLHFGAWAPKDETDYTGHWRAAAEAADVMDVHAYGQGEGIIGHIEKYRALFPARPIRLTEWHSDFDGPEQDRHTLELLADYAARTPSFAGADYFLWRWDGAPSHQQDMARAIAVEGNPDRLALFQDPPVISLPEPEPTPMPNNPYEHFSAALIASASECPLANVEAHWPKLVEQLNHCGINERLVQVGLIGTISIESASTFAPVREAYYLGEPEPAETYRKTLPYYPYFGRGEIQLTHRASYAAMGPKIAALWGTDPSQPDFQLEADPDRALDPDIAAAVSAIFFRDTATIQGYSLVDACRAEDWSWVRRLVYGSVDVEGTARIARIAAALGGEPVPVPTPGPLPFDPDAPIDQQPDDWSCSVQSVQWLLRSIGRNPGDGWLEQQLVPALVSKSVGLLDGSGAQLAAWLNREYGAEMGFTAAATPVTFDDVKAGAGVNPTIVGGHNYGPGGHWVGIRRATGDGLLELANPADNYTGTGPSLDRAEWDARGPWDAIYIDRGAVVAPPAPVPDPIPDPQPARADVLLDEIEQRLAELRGLVV